MEYISLKENMVNIDFDKIASEIVKGKTISQALKKYLKSKKDQIPSHLLY